MFVRVTFFALLVVCLAALAAAKDCYQCTTIDPDCQNDKVKASKFLKPCPGDMGNSCRTILQVVEKETRIIRQCSNVTSVADMRCMERLGTSQVKVTYCHCKDDGCNSAGSLAGSLGIAALFAILTKLLV